jgi:hypothetical protein
MKIKTTPGKNMIDF